MIRSMSQGSTADPTTYTAGQIAAIYETLGLTPGRLDDTTEIRILPDLIIVTRVARNEAGRVYSIVPNGPLATETPTVLHFVKPHPDEVAAP